MNKKQIDKKRLDQLLVDLKLAPSKTKAQELIESGQVTIREINRATSKKTLKSAHLFDPNEVEIILSEQNILKYVSRGGFKLEGALSELSLDVQGFVALDVGQSTGGFTDCLLQAGAKHVTGIDVAEKELAQRLASDPRVLQIANVNARDLGAVTLLHDKKFDLIVMDLSFISLELVVPGVVEYLKPGGHLLALVKPQFEVGSANIGKGGIVKSAAAVERVEKKLCALASSLGLVGIRYFQAKIKGRDGNQEFFLYARLAKKGTSNAIRKNK